MLLEFVLKRANLQDQRQVALMYIIDNFTDKDSDEFLCDRRWERLN